MIGSVKWVLDGVPFNEVTDAVDEGALFQDLTETLLAKVAQTDQQMDQHACWDVFFEEIEESRHYISKHSWVPLQGVQHLVAVQDIGQKS